MRFMVLATPAEGAPPTAAALWRYNEELVRAGVLLVSDGPASSARGARVRYTGRRVVFEEGDDRSSTAYWLIEVASRREAVEWAHRCPCTGEVEIHRVREPAEFTALSPEHEDYLRAQIAHR
ncbi:YciI family protein [Actinophytocola sp.]|uniref:YciI family protein n=1 Tax=Actinophytocola sp. TaxID=1872138 RepID=UPI003D6AB16F